MNICFITNSPHIGGAERVLLETIDVLKERGVSCRVLLPAEGALSSELTRISVPYAFLDGGSWISWQKPSLLTRMKATIKISARLYAAARKIRQWGCDAIYSNTLTVCNGSIVAKLLKLPHIWHIHEFGREDHGVFYKFGEDFSNRTIGTLSSACIFVSNALAAKYAPFIASSKMSVIYPSMHRAGNQALNVMQPVPASTGRFRLVIVGGLVEGKGQADAVRALSHLMQAGVDAELLIVGEMFPEYSGILQELVQRNGLDDRVNFVGKVDNPFPFFQSADIVLVCSRSEAFGRVTVEAMFAGKAVVGANCGATPELVRENYSGLLYEQGNSADLAFKLKVLSEQPELLRRLEKNAKDWATSHFAKERYADELMALLSSTVRHHSVVC